MMGGSYRFGDNVAAQQICTKPLRGVGKVEKCKWSGTEMGRNNLNNKIKMVNFETG